MKAQCIGRAVVLEVIEETALCFGYPWERRNVNEIAKAKFKAAKLQNCKIQNQNRKNEKVLIAIPI